MAECEKTTPVYNPSNSGEIIGWITVEPDGEITCECAFTGMSWGFCDTEEQAADLLRINASSVIDQPLI